MQTNEKKIVVFGCQKIAISLIDFILNGKFFNNENLFIIPKIELVVTKDEQRDLITNNELVGSYCNRVGLKNIEIKNKKDFDIIGEINPDLIFSFYYRKIIPGNILNCAKMGAINIHPGLLPKYRGCVPSYWAILNNEDWAGSTLHYMDGGIDSGDIIAQRKIKIDDKSGAQLHIELMGVGIDIFKDNFCSILFGENNRVVQGNDVTYYGPFLGEYKYINWNNQSKKILRHIQAHRKPFAGSRAWNNDCEILLNSCEILGEFGSCVGKYEVVGNKIKIQTSDKKILCDYETISGSLKQTGAFVSGIKH